MKYIVVVRNGRISTDAVGRLGGVDWALRTEARSTEFEVEAIEDCSGFTRRSCGQSKYELDKGAWP